MPESELTSGNIQFVQNYRPALQAGNYKIEVAQEVSGKQIVANNKFYQEKEFFIRGERFNFKPLVIDSVFPPDMSQGDFQNTLPHIVFNNLTLPWERSLKIDGVGFHPHTDESGNIISLEAENGDSSAWMALFLFDENDPAPIPQKIKLRELYEDKRPKGVWFPPAFELQYGESMDDECFIIDIPKDLFISICPSIDELKLLAHGRIVNVDHKAKEKNSQLSGNYSVIIGSRLPNEGKESMVHLVSLEGFASAIHNPDETLKDHHYVRLVTFRKWRFSCFDRPESFKKLLSHLNDADPKRETTDITKIKRLDNLLRYPLDDGKTSHKEMRALLQSGYIPMNHKMRQGYKTVSLYRGPFVPVPINEKFIKAGYANQDQLYFYDPDTGFLDVSYGAAWQLGQLLGLKNQQFAKQLYKWKRQAKLEDIQSWEKNQVDKIVLNKTGIGDAGVLNPFNENLLKSIKPDHEILKEGEFKNIKNPNPFQRHVPKEGVILTSPENPPDEVINYLDELNALHHVPFTYLVPDPTMLPRESLKFFYLDHNWTMALRAGAMSVGDFAIRGVKEVTKIRTNNSNVIDDNEVMETISGFLIRSAVLVGWPGMEIIVKDSDGNNLNYVRLERMAPDTALIMVKGLIHSVTFREPGEGLHFGINLDENPENPKKYWRNNQGDFTGEFKQLTLNQQKVIDISTLAAGLPKRPDNALNTTADFAYQMVEGMDKVVFTLQNNQGE